MSFKKDAIENLFFLAYNFQLFPKKYMAKSRQKSPVGRKNPKTGKDAPIPGGKTSSEIVKRHLSNKDDKITEDDLRNVRIDTSIPKDKAHEPLPIKSTKQRPKDSEKDNTINTPWDVISE